jgi:transporter family protein
MNNWLVLVLLSAVILGIYDITRKHAVRNNSAICVLLIASIAGAIAFSLYVGAIGRFPEAIACTQKEFWLIFLKSCVVGGSWGCVYTAMRKLPISLAAPVRSTAPLWTFIAAIFIYGEVPSLLAGLGMAIIFVGYYALSVVGQLEGFSLKNKSMLLIVAGTILGSCAALYDKYLLNQLALSPIRVQLYFSYCLVFIYFVAWLIVNRIAKVDTAFTWRWTIPVTGVLLIVSDLVYFHAVSLPDAQISMISLLRRCSCVITFAVGAMIFKDKNVVKKFYALLIVLIGIVLLALGK